MSLCIRVSGPAGNAEFTLEEGDEWTLGRDDACQICLRSPTISRRHLGLKCEGGELTFSVLSSVNSVQGPQGLVSPGGIGRAGMGDVIAVGEYRLEVAEANVSASPQDDEGTSDVFRFPRRVADDVPPSADADVSNPWRALIREWDEQLGLTGVSVPFDKERANPPGFVAFFEGMGLKRPALTVEQAWRAGLTVRLIVEVLVDLLAARALVKREFKAADRTVLAAKDNNPLKLPIPTEEKLRYLLFPTPGDSAFLPPDRMLEDTLSDLRNHELASLAATRAVVEGTICEFDPQALRKRLRKGHRAWPRVLDDALTWHAYERDYEAQSAAMTDWIEQCFSRYYASAYANQKEQLKGAG